MLAFVDGSGAGAAEASAEAKGQRMCSLTRILDAEVLAFWDVLAFVDIEPI